MCCSFKDPSLYQSPGSKCKPCPVVHPSPVCGTDGHSYSTKVSACTLTEKRVRTQGPFNHSYLSSVSVAQCKLDYQVCITGKKIAVRCPGMCPCPAQLQTSSTEKTGIYSHLWHTDAIILGIWFPLWFRCSLVCSELDLKEVVSRLKDWFRVLHENGNHKRVKKPEKNSESKPGGISQAPPPSWQQSPLMLWGLSSGDSKLAKKVCIAAKTRGMQTLTSPAWWNRLEIESLEMESLEIESLEIESCSRSCPAQCS